MIRNRNKKRVEVVLIDDDADDQEIFSEALQDAMPDVNFCSISNDRELFSFFNEKTIPDLFFLDWSVHCQFEVNCLYLIKQQDHLKKVPVIIYSGLTSEHEIKELYKKGAALFVNKPSSYRDLTEILKTLLTIKWDKFNLETAKNTLLKEFNAIKIPE